MSVDVPLVPRPPLSILAGAGAGLLTLTVVAASVMSTTPDKAASRPASPMTTTTTAPLATAPPPVAQAQVSVPIPTTVTPTRAARPPAAAAPARAAAPSSGSTAGGPAEKGAAALALVHYPIDQTGFKVVFEGPRSGVLGLTSTGSHTITIYVRSSQSVAAVAHVLAHETGHAVDIAFTTDAERSQYRTIRGLGNQSWYSSCDSCADYNTPAGDFAEVFAYWLMGGGPFLSTAAGTPTASQLAALGPIFAPSPMAPPATVATTTTTTPPVTAAPTTTTTTPQSFTWTWPMPGSGTGSGTGTGTGGMTYPYPWVPRR